MFLDKNVVFASDILILFDSKFIRDKKSYIQHSKSIDQTLSYEQVMKIPTWESQSRQLLYASTSIISLLTQRVRQRQRTFFFF